MTSTTSKVLSLRMDSDLFDRLHTHAGKRGMSVQDYVVRALVRHDFDERLRTSVEEAERFFDSSPCGPAREPGDGSHREGGRENGGEHSREPDREPDREPGRSGPHRVASRPAPARSGRA